MVATIDQHNHKEPMQIDKLFSDATGVKLSESGREKQRAVSAMLTEAGWPVPAETVKQWVRRKSIPGTWLVKIIHAARNNGKKLDLTKYT